VYSISKVLEPDLMFPGWGAWLGRHERAAGDSGVLRGALQVL